MKLIKQLIPIVALSLIMNACNNDNNMPEFPTKYVRISETTITVKTEEENKITIHPIFDSEETAKGKFIWSIADPAVAKIKTNADHSVTIEGLEVGQTILKIESEDGKLMYFADLKTMKAYPFVNPILLDFGAIKSSSPFNSFSISDKAMTMLLDKEDKEFDYGIRLNDENFKTLVRTNLPNGLGLPNEVLQDFFFNDGINVESGSMSLFNLNKRLKYTLVIYASIMDGGASTQYTVNGATEDTQILITAQNASRVAIIKDMIPDEKGEIKITVSAAPNNTHWAKFWNISVLALVPEGYDLGTIF